ncbi:hypothetical protein FGO68_gene1 [Halteria grandinella]|uniref:Tyrosine specific protein phosphatases domain-containing protein n=1 Tax=Halteria grandinella TaxID=5974 RepID=A0A8J8T3G6_HALGN|nr:hypothetical protein FGO68_gene1 [Halteria grandinella]
MIDKADANFVGGLFFSKIGDTGIYIGPYPQTQDDAKALYSAGITGVLNVQTEKDHNSRSIDWSKMQTYYRQLQIEPVWSQIDDQNGGELELKLHDAANKLYEMITKKQLKVYVYCTTGMNRAPTVVLAYLSLFYGMDPLIAEQYVKSHRSVSEPNLAAVVRVVQQFRK